MAKKHTSFCIYWCLGLGADSTYLRGRPRPEHCTGLPASTLHITQDQRRNPDRHKGPWCRAGMSGGGARRKMYGARLTTNSDLDLALLDRSDIVWLGERGMYCTYTSILRYQWDITSGFTVYDTSIDMNGIQHTEVPQHQMRENSPELEASKYILIRGTWAA